MTSPSDPARRLLDRLRARGVKLRAEGGRLLVEPASLLGPADRAAIGLRREALLDLLWAEQPDTRTVIGSNWFSYNPEPEPCPNP